jgi:hypothetical protein
VRVACSGEREYHAASTTGAEQTCLCLEQRKAKITELELFFFPLLVVILDQFTMSSNCSNYMPKHNRGFNELQMSKETGLKQGMLNE